MSMGLLAAGRRVGAVLLLAAVVVVAIAASVWRDYTRPGPLAVQTTVVIPRGAGLQAVATELAAKGIVAHPWVFVIGTAISGRAGALKAGEYEVPSASSARAVADLLASGRVLQHRLTIPEGLTSTEVVALVNAAPSLDGKIDKVPPEGSLLPDTYFYVLGERRAELIAHMHRAMTKALAKVWAARQPGLPLKTPEDALILASIIEKETARPDERARIAGVYIDRLRLGMRLQADPTVIYALTRGGAVPLDHALDHADLAVESPYNTYLNKGLPPTPIANPGLASLRAAVAPEDRGELYFVADGNGGHSFAHTLAEQNRNVAALHREKAEKAGAK